MMVQVSPKQPFTIRQEQVMNHWHQWQDAPFSTLQWAGGRVRGRGCIPTVSNFSSWQHNICTHK